MDKSAERRLGEGLAKLGLTVPPGCVGQLLGYADLLLRWNERVNLTAITAPEEVVEKHLLDSLAVTPEVQGATSLIDLGAGAGLPGLPLALAIPGLSVVLVEGVGKKVAFLKSAIVALGLVGRVRAVQVHAAGKPEAEGIPPADVVISRAFREPAGFLSLATAYLGAQGRAVAMLGQLPEASTLEAAAAQAGLRVVGTRSWNLPFSGDPRAAAVFAR